MSWENKSIEAKEVAKLYSELKGEWLLLDVLKRGANDKAEEFVLVAHSKEKDDLYDYIMEEGDEIKGNLIFVFADPDEVCEV